MQDDRIPNNVEAERTILGAILLNSLLLDKASRDLKPEWFYSEPLRKTYNAMVALRERQEPVEHRSVVLELQRDGFLESVGGPGFVSNLTYGLPFSPDISYYVGHVREAAQLRRLLAISAHVTQMSLDGDPVGDVLNFAQSQLDGMKEVGSKTRKAQRFLSEMIDDQALRYRLWHKGVSDAMATGFVGIDDRLLGGGLIKSGLYILAARPSLGKTSLALDITANIANEGKRVYFVSREMPCESLFDRLHAAYAGIARWKLRPGIYEAEYKTLLRTLPKVGQLPVYLDNLSLTVNDVRKEILRLDRNQQRPQILVVDYIQLLTANGKQRSRNDEVGSITRGLKGLAMEFELPILALSQLSRDCDKQHREPELSDLRDSGEIEQDADAVFFLFGDKPEEGAKFFARTLKCAKQRDGQLFRDELTFNGELVTFRSFEQLAIQGIHDHTEATQ